jgi:hypothetical protein
MEVITITDMGLGSGVLNPGFSIKDGTRYLYQFKIVFGSS